MNSVRGKPRFGINFISTQVSFLIDIFGGNSSSLSGTLFYNSKKITCDLVKLGLFPWLAFTFTFCILIASTKSSFKKRLLTIAIGFILHYIYLIARFSFLCTIIPNDIFAGIQPFNLFFWQFPLVSFSPLIILWFIIITEAGSTSFPVLPEYSPVPITKKDIVAGIFFLLASLILTVYYNFPGFTEREKINILIDEIHSQWESTLIDFDETITGILAENSYHSLLDYLSHFYSVTVLTDKPPGAIKSLPEGVDIVNANILTPRLLDINSQFPEGKTMLILKCITRPFTGDEIDVIKDFVFKGGSVFLIGDHTDVFFMNKNINELSKHFGIRYEQNSIYFVDGGWVITDRQNYRLHPATSYLKKFIWATGDSLKLAPPAFPLIYSSFVCFADEVNYFLNNFFGNNKIDMEEIFGSFCLLAGSEYGKGKVIAFTDSTCFNNYLMFTVGRRELIAGINGWFAGKKRVNPFFGLALISLFCVITIFTVYRRPEWGNLIYLLIVFGAIGWITGYALSNKLNSTLYVQPGPLKPLPPRVFIDSSHNPAYCLSFGNSESFLSETSYDNLIFNTGRVNVFPEIIYKGKITKDILDSTGCLIICSPRKDYTPKEKRDIENYVINGGSLLLVEGANPGTTINQIANLFDLNIRTEPYRDTVSRMKEYLSRLRKPAKINPARVDGGETLFAFEQMPIVCFLRKGKGIILVIGEDTIFMRKNVHPYLTSLQCKSIKALLNKDEQELKSIHWNYLEW